MTASACLLSLPVALMTAVFVLHAAIPLSRRIFSTQALERASLDSQPTHAWE